MTPDRFRECLALLHWSQRGLADILGMDERQVRRWASGATIPEPIADWMEKLARYHERNPPPERKVQNVRTPD
jgi:transcriptional regulator with XRE-family HTH domain